MEDTQSEIRKLEIMQVFLAYLKNRKGSLMHKLSSLTASSIFNCQMLSEIIIMLLTKCNNLLNLIKTQSEESNSAMGFIKWVVQIDLFAHEVLYDVTEEETKAEESGYDVKRSGSLYKCLEEIVHSEILSEDYIRQLLKRYNGDKSEKNRTKLELMCFKTHHLVFYHITDILKLISYLTFKTPTLPLLHHFACDRILLSKLKDLFVNICEILGSKEYLDFYNKMISDTEKRVKNDKQNDESWVDWIMSSINAPTQKYDQVNEVDDEDGNIGNDEEGDQDENIQDDEDMYIVLSKINDNIVTLFSTWDKIFILHGKNTDIIDCYSQLMQNNILINAKRVEFRNSLEDAELLQKSEVYKADDSVDVINLMTVKSIIPVLDINFTDENADDQPQYYYSEKFEKVCDLVITRIESITSSYQEVCEDDDISELSDKIKTLFEGICFNQPKGGVSSEIPEVSFETNSAFKSLLKYVKSSSVKKLLKQYSNFVYPAYSFSIIDKYLKKDNKDDDNALQMKLRIEGERLEQEQVKQFDFVDAAMTAVIAYIMYHRFWDDLEEGNKTSPSKSKKVKKYTEEGEHSDNEQGTNIDDLLF